MRRTVIVALALLVPSVASATPAVEGRFFFERGSQHYRNARYLAAAEDFLLSYEIAPSPGALYNAALASLRGDNRADAYSFLQAYLLLEDDDPERRRDAETRMAQLLRELAIVHVESSPPGAWIYVDRDERGAFGTTPRDVVVEPGAHTIHLSMDRHIGQRVEVEGVAGERRHLQAELSPQIGSLRLLGSPEGAAVQVQLATSPDCGADWTIRSLGFTADDMPSYLIEPDADGVWWHELLFVDEIQQLLRYRSSSGEPGSFEPTPIEPPPPPFPLTLRQPPLSEDLPPEFNSGRFYRFMRVGTDLVLIAGPYGDGGAVRLYVETQDEWTQIGDPALPGSGRPATFDRWRVTRAAAALDPDEQPLDPEEDAKLLLVYSGVGDNACQTDYQCAEPGGAAALVFAAAQRPGAP